MEKKGNWPNSLNSENTTPNFQTLNLKWNSSYCRLISTQTFGSCSCITKYWHSWIPKVFNILLLLVIFSIRTWWLCLFLFLDLSLYPEIQIHLIPEIMIQNKLSRFASRMLHKYQTPEAVEFEGLQVFFVPYQKSLSMEMSIEKLIFQRDKLGY